jgi:hypothetical protein
VSSLDRPVDANDCYLGHCFSVTFFATAVNHYGGDQTPVLSANHGIASACLLPTRKRG